MSKPIRYKESKLTQKTTGYVFLLPIMAMSLIMTMPSLVQFFAPTKDTLDLSWAWMLGYGIQHGMPWGKSLIFTYGPLGFMANPFFYGDHLLWGLSAVTRVLTWLGFGMLYAVISLLFPRNEQAPTINMLAVVIAWIIGASFVDVSTQSAFIALLLLAYALQKGQSKSTIIVLILAGALLAFGALIKVTALIVASFVLLLYPILWAYVCNTRKLVLESFIGLFSFLIVLFVFLLGSSLHIANLVSYVRATLSIATGYTPAMSGHGERLQTIGALLILLLFVVTGLRFLARRNRLVVAQLLVFGVILFWAWKEGFTRHDPGFRGGHAMAFYGIALLVSGVMMPIVSNAAHKADYTIIAGAYMVALMFALPGAGVLNVNEVWNYKTFYSLITSPVARESLQASQDRALKAQFHLAPATLQSVQGVSVNIVPWDLMMAQGYRMDLLPSPVFQAYLAYTPYLDRVNANQIWRKWGAQRIMYSFMSIDGRYPVFDEPTTFRAMLTCYHTAYAGRRYSVLKRNPCAKPKLLRIGAMVKQRFGAWISVPSNADYMGVDIHTGVIGRLADIFYKPNEVYIIFRLADGSIKGPFRFVYRVGGDGLFVKYFVNDQQDASRLFAANASGLRKIAAFRLTTASHSLDYATKFETTFYKVNPPHSFLVKWGMIHMPVMLTDPVPQALLAGQSVLAKFALDGSQLQGPASVFSIGIFQGNYGNTANGRMRVKICYGSACAVGSRPLSQSHDNSFFIIPLRTSLVMRPGETVTLTIRHQGGNKPDALWVWPSALGYAQDLRGPQGPLPGKGIRIALSYTVQDKP